MDNLFQGLVRYITMDCDMRVRPTPGPHGHPQGSGGIGASDLGYG